ncbi:MAG TPA: hypothetical protein VHP34_07720 [Alphaproteobacteria bacterium]|nr:hypothetical protein [Alphaproteobacteria bacterium]
MSLKFWSRKTSQKKAETTHITDDIDKTVKSLMTAFYLAAGASGTAMAGLAGASLLDQDGRAAFEHCVRGANVCTQTQMADVQRFELRSQWQMSATMIFLTFFPAALWVRNGEKLSARQAERAEEKRKEIRDLQMDLRKEQKQSRGLKEELAELKNEIAPYRAQKEADDARAEQQEAQHKEAQRMSDGMMLKDAIGVSKPMMLKRK